MLKGGWATVYVSDMDRAVEFYAKSLDLRLQFRAGNEWAQIDAGDGLILGLHIKSHTTPEPGAPGGINIGFNVTQPLEQVLEKLKKRGVALDGGIHEDKSVRLAFFSDPDGNNLYLCEVKEM